uniref:Uncharacterized protein n=1 Tax=Panagrolaimus superbus TaxID=310955 RepID=A0A914XWW0_9BILA
MDYYYKIMKSSFFGTKPHLKIFQPESSVGSKLVGVNAKLFKGAIDLSENAASVLILASVGVIFGKDLEFTVSPFIQTSRFFKIIDVKGDFEITKITMKSGFDEGEIQVDYDAERKTFTMDEDFFDVRHFFYITTKIELKQIFAVGYTLLIPFHCLRILKLHQYLKDKFVIFGYNGLKFIYYVKKVGISDVQIHNENPYDVAIEGMSFVKHKKTIKHQ